MLKLNKKLNELKPTSQAFIQNCEGFGLSEVEDRYRMVLPEIKENIRRHFGCRSYVDVPAEIVKFNMN